MMSGLCFDVFQCCVVYIASDDDSPKYVTRQAGRQWSEQSARAGAGDPSLLPAQLSLNKGL